MPRTGDYNLFITATEDRLVIKPEDFFRLVDFLDSKQFLEGPDRDFSQLVIRSHQEVKDWEPFARSKPDDPLPKLRRRQVNLLFSPAAPYDNLKQYSQLLAKLEHLIPPDASLVVSLGYGTRQLAEIISCPVPGQDKPWIQTLTVHLLRGFHPLWTRVYNREEEVKEWDLLGVKSFTLMLACKLDPQLKSLKLNKFLHLLPEKPEFVDFLRQIGAIIGTKEFELLGGKTE